MPPSQSTARGGVTPQGGTITQQRPGKWAGLCINDMATWFVFWKTDGLGATKIHACSARRLLAGRAVIRVIEYMTIGSADHTLTFNTTRRQAWKPNQTDFMCGQALIDGVAANPYRVVETRRDWILFWFHAGIRRELWILGPHGIEAEPSMLPCPIVENDKMQGGAVPFDDLHLRS
jgi:hypothetical protein